jgi:hypothetical protein
MMTQEEILQSPKFQMEAALIRRCSEEPEFRAKVLANPKSMLEEALGQKLPENVSIFIHEEDLHTLHFSVPPTRENLEKELTDEQLEQVAGGTLTSLVAASVMTFVGLIGASAAVSASVAVTAGAGVTGAAIATVKFGKW